MQRERIAHFIAIFSGILIGAFGAQSLANAIESGKYFWFLGALLGGIIAWISVDVWKFIAGVVCAVRHAWQQTIAWRPNVEHWKNIGRLYLLGLSCFSTFAVFFMRTDLSKPFDQLNKQGELATHTLEILPYIFFAAVTFLVFLAGFICTLMSLDSQNSVLFSKEQKRWLNLLILYMNPVGLFVFALKGLAQFVQWGFSTLPFALRHIRLYLRCAVRLTFLYTNHERRTASLVFAALGVMVGYFVGYIPIVALAGALLGVLEFELTKSVRARMSNQLRINT